MAKFNEGDRVRLLIDYDYLVVGDEGTVTGIDTGDPEYPLRVKFDDAVVEEADLVFSALIGIEPDAPWLVAEHEVELV